MALLFPHAINKKSAEIILSGGYLEEKDSHDQRTSTSRLVVGAIPQDLTMEKKKNC